MQGIVCDGCSSGLLIDGDVRYVVEVKGYAAYDPLELTAKDLERDLNAEVKELAEQLRECDPQQAEDSVHKEFSFDLCPRCWFRFINKPLGSLDEKEGER